MKIIIFTSNKNAYSIGRLKEEATSQKIKVEIYNYKDISFMMNEKNIIFSSEKKQINFTGSVIRLGRPQLYNVRDMKIYNLLINHFYQHNIFFINQEFLKKHLLVSHKAIQYLLLSQYTKKLIKPTLYFESEKEFLHNIEKIKYPIIIKPVDGSLGTGVRKINNEHLLREKFKYLDPKDFIFQKYIPNTGDLRVLFIGGKYIGSMLRQGKSGSIVNNFSKGGNVHNHILKESIKKDLELLVKNLNIDYVGIDIIEKSGTYYILEINQNPGFEGFELCTNQNIAKKIIEFLKKQSK